jgi:hypothetical protein
MNAKHYMHAMIISTRLHPASKDIEVKLGPDYMCSNALSTQGTQGECRGNIARLEQTVFAFLNVATGSRR